MILWLASYPRSGNGYLRAVIASLYGRPSWDRYQPVPRPGQRVPYFGCFPGRSLDELAAAEEWWPVKTHDLPESDGFPAIYLVRDGRDALVSYAEYTLRWRAQDDPVESEAFRTTLRNLIVERGSPFGTWSQSVAAWIARPNTVMLRFEDLIRSTDPLVDAVSCLNLGWQPRPNASVPAFEALREMHPPSFRRGRIGTWKVHMPADLQDLFWRQQGATLVRLGYETPRIEPHGGPRFTIVVLLPGSRGMALQALASWTSGQTFSSERFEVVVLSDGSDRALDDRIRPALRTGDRLLTEATDNFSRLHDLGARSARGEFVVFTESHVMGEPSFLEELDAYLRETSFEGAATRTVAIGADPFAENDAALWEEGFCRLQREDDWRKWNVHGVALRRQTYLDVGGLPHRYDRFAETLLAATLRDRGIRLGYAERAVVRHRFRSTLTDLVHDADRFVRGESLYRHEHPEDRRVGHTFLEPTWAQGGDATLAREIAAALARDAAGYLRPDVTTLATFKEGLLGVLRSEPWASAAAKVSLAEAMLRCHLLRRSPGRLRRAYPRVWDAAVHRSRLHFLRTHERRPRTEPGCPMTSMADVADGDLWGFHSVERSEGDLFRWTGRLAAVRLPLPAESCVVWIETRDLRPEPEALGLRVYCNRRRVPGEALRAGRGFIRFDLDRDDGRARSPSILVLTCRPLRPWESGVPDRRELGLPVFGVRHEARTP